MVQSSAMIIETNDYIGLRQAAREFSVRYSSLKRAIVHSKTLQAVEVGDGTFLVKRQDVQAYLENIPRGGKPFHKPKTEQAT